MKILIINDMYREWGGTETYILEIKKILEKNKHKVHIIAFSDKQLESTDLTLIIHSKNKYMLNFRRFFFSFEIYNKFKKKIKEFNPDVIHLHNNNQYSLSVLLAIKNSKIPAIFTVHDWGVICANGWGVLKKNYYKKCTCVNGIGIVCLYNGCISFNHWLISFFRNKLRSYFNKRIFKAYISPSNSLKKDLEEHGFLNIFWNPSFIDSKSKTNSFNKRENTILYVGSLSENKGVKYLIEAFNIFHKQNPKFKLKIIGDGSEMNNLLDIVRNLLLKDSVEFTGRIPHNEVLKEFSKAKIFVVPSVWMENSPFVIIEALSHGLPVIGTNRGGITDFVINNKNGFLVEVANPEELNKSIEKIANNKKLWLNFSKNSLNLVKQADSKKHYKKLMEIYNSISN